MPGGMCTYGDARRHIRKIFASEQGQHGNATRGLAGPVIKLAAESAYDKDRRGKIIALKKGQGVLGEVTEAIVEGEGHRTWAMQNLIEGDYGNTGGREKFHLAAENLRRGGDYRTGVIERMPGEDR